MRIATIILFLFLSTQIVSAKSVYFGTPDQITNWVVSCSVDSGSIRSKGGEWVFTTSKNRCKGGIYKQRAEINTKGALSTKKATQYRFQSYFRMTSDAIEKFDIFQIHDSRDGCAPPLKVNVQPSGRLKLYSDYKIGPGEQCVRNVMKSTGLGKTKVKRDGREYKLDVLLDFEGQGGFHVAVYIDDRFEVSGRYNPPKEKGYYISRYFYFKHGVYSQQIFDYLLTSDMSMKRIDSLDEEEKLFEKSRLEVSKDNLILSTKPITIPANLTDLLDQNNEFVSCIKDEALTQGLSDESIMNYINLAKIKERVAVYRIATFIRNGFCNFN